MGVYIKGVVKPKSCGECFIGRRFMCEHVETFEDCPMVEIKEPHGRLIDAYKVVSYVPSDEAPLCKYLMAKAVLSVPTVIEGSE